MEENKNLELYNRVRDVPKEAIKPIMAGRLKGKSDINPMWRIKKLTEEFGMCGFGWRYEILRMWKEEGANGEIASFVHINLFVRHDGEWSEAIQGIGGSSFVSNEKTGKYTSDECYKMALTDAISVACKSLGFAADIYFSNDSTKYTGNKPENNSIKQDKKKPIPSTMFNDTKVMKWLYDNETYYRNNNQRVSLSSLLEQNYAISKEDIQKILSNYEQYKINFNLS